MNALLHYQQFLEQALKGDPQGQLALLAVWLDPLCLNTLQWEDAEDSSERSALSLVRDCLPDLYLEAIQCLYQGHSLEHAGDVICQRLNAFGIPLQDLLFMDYGIPLPAYGCSRSDPDFQAQCPQADLVRRCFGVDWEEGEPPSQAQTDIALLVALALRRAPAPLPEVGWVVAWVWGITGITCLDLDEESLLDCEPLAWTAENVAFARDLIAEANTLLVSIESGVSFLATHPAFFSELNALVHKAHTLYHHTYPKGTLVSNDSLKKLARHLQLGWTTATRRFNRNASHGLDLL